MTVVAGVRAVSNEQSALDGLLLPVVVMGWAVAATGRAVVVVRGFEAGRTGPAVGKGLAAGVTGPAVGRGLAAGGMRPAAAAMGAAGRPAGVAAESND